MKPLRVILAAAGTGGHLIPARSLAESIREQAPESEFLFVGSGRQMEDKIIDPGQWKRINIKSSGFKGNAIVGKIKAVYRAFAAIRQIRRIIKDFKPDLFIGAGGYVTVPCGLAAKSTSVPLVLLEQNSMPGLSNRLLSKFAKLVFLGNEDAERFFPAGKCVFTGNPVRPEIARLHELRRDYSKKPFCILVTGGSQGASALNRAVVNAVKILREDGSLDFKIIHQSGSADLECIQNVYKELGIDFQVKDFFKDMATIYQEAHLVISRAGALTVAEITAAKLPSILVPLPGAADDHQTANAKSLEKNGAALLIDEKQLTGASLSKQISDLMGNVELLEKMSAASGKAASLGAAEKMAKLCFELVERN